MRRLLYVPIVHDDADMGSLGPTLASQSAAALGSQRWRTHQSVVRRYWDSVAAYLFSLDASRLKIYQDGLPAGGDMARRIAEQAAARGSKNYRLLVELVRRGAELQQTEDPPLLLEEHRYTSDMVLGKRGGKTGHSREQQGAGQRASLMDARDRFIARRIADTLGRDDQGVLFIGANHQVAQCLPGDIAVQFAREPERVAPTLESCSRGMILGP